MPCGQQAHPALFALAWVGPLAQIHAVQKTSGGACSPQGKKSGSDEPFGHIGFFVGWRIEKPRRFSLLDLPVGDSAALRAMRSPAEAALRGLPLPLGGRGLPLRAPPPLLGPEPNGPGPSLSLRSGREVSSFGWRGVGAAPQWPSTTPPPPSLTRRAAPPGLKAL